MYKIYKTGEDLYEIHSSFANEKSMEGTRLAVLYYAVNKLGFNVDELGFAFLELIANEDKGHDALEFGINRRFIFSYPRYVRKYG